MLEPGEGFTILSEQGHWWKVEAAAGVGWVDHRYCLINLPDVIPSMLYDAVNSYGAVYVSSGKEIPGVTGESFYPGAAYNPRLDREEFMMPMLYAAAKRVCAAQHAALAQGNCLKLYEAFRPRSTQLAVIDGLTALAEEDPEVKAGITTPPWSMTYFINTGYSNHQRGFAVDVSLVKVKQTEVRTTGGREYLAVTDFIEYDMPTAIHELSMAAASTLGPGVILSAVPLTLYQGGIALLAGQISGFLSENVIAQMSAVGSLLIIGLGMNMFGLTKERIRVGNMLPAMVVILAYQPAAEWLARLFA